MPIYTFKCETCGREEDKIVGYDVEAITSDKCETEENLECLMKRLDTLHPSMLQFKGRWFKNTRGY